MVGGRGRIDRGLSYCVYGKTWLSGRARITANNVIRIGGNLAIFLHGFYTSLNAIKPWFYQLRHGLPDRSCRQCIGVKLRIDVAEETQTVAAPT